MYTDCTKSCILVVSLHVHSTRHSFRYFELCKLAGDCHSSLGNLYHKNLTSVSVSVI